MPKTQDFWVFILSPGDLDSRRHMGPRLAAQGTLTRSAGDLDSQRQLRSLGAASRGPLRCESRFPQKSINTTKKVPKKLFS